ncbi:DUF2535 family protein [Alkalihalobacterium sp. APHAB7]|uniref:DUF2535 family protein n=1 Tax=Alkalihalobacterium sp. APHAB7 TaxID=3402081 RepID=UPI003AAAC8B4
MLYKTLEFQNVLGQKVKVIEIPVVARNHQHYFMIQARLQMFISQLYNQPKATSSFSFRDYLKQKMEWSEFERLFSMDARIRKNHHTNDDTLIFLPACARNRDFPC